MSQEKVFDLKYNEEEFKEAQKRFLRIFPGSSIVKDIEVSQEEDMPSIGTLMQMVAEFAKNDPSKEEIDDFYMESIHSVESIVKLVIAILVTDLDTDYGMKKKQITETIYGLEYGTEYSLENRRTVGDIIDTMMCMHMEHKLWVQIGWVLLDYLCSLDSLKVEIKNKRDRSGCYREENSIIPLYSFQTILVPMVNMLHAVRMKDANYFSLIFPVYQKFFLREDVDQIPLNVHARYFSLGGRIGINTLDYIRAYGQNVITFQQMREYIYSLDKKAVFPKRNLTDTLSVISNYYDGCIKLKSGREFRKNSGSVGMAKEFLEWTKNDLTEKEQFASIEMLYSEIIDEILAVEIHRGNKKSEFSSNIYGILHLYGFDRMIPFLKGLQDEGLRISMKKSKSSSKQAVWSYLLKVSKPDIYDTKEECCRKMEQNKIDQEYIDDLLELAPAWKRFFESHREVVDEPIAVITDERSLVEQAYEFMIKRRKMKKSQLKPSPVTDEMIDAFEKEMDIKVPGVIRVYLKTYAHSVTSVKGIIPSDELIYPNGELMKVINELKPKAIETFVYEEEIEPEEWICGLLTVPAKKPLSHLKDLVKSFRETALFDENIKLEQVKHFLPIAIWMNAGYLCIDTTKKEENVDYNDPDTWMLSWFDHEELDFAKAGYIDDNGKVTGAIILPDVRTFLLFYFYGVLDDFMESDE